MFGLVRWEEQSAIAAIEAMQHGLPAVGSDSGALPEILGCPRAVNPQGSSRALARCFRLALESPDWLERLSAFQRRRARLLYDINSAAKSFSNVMDSLRSDVSVFYPRVELAPT